MAEAGRACVLGVDGRAGEPERALGEPVKPQEEPRWDARRRTVTLQGERVMGRSEGACEP